MTSVIVCVTCLMTFPSRNVLEVFDCEEGTFDDGESTVFLPTLFMLI